MAEDVRLVEEVRLVEVDLRWQVSALTQSLFGCAAAALVAALVSGRWQLVLLAAPMLGVLSTIGWQTPPRRLTVQAAPALQRCFEGEQVRICVELVALPDAAAVDFDARLDVTAPPGMRLETGPEGTAVSKTVSVGAQRWGRYPLSATVSVVAPGGLLTASASADLADVLVFPLVPPPSTAIPQSEVPDRLGTHLTRHTGPGVEYADIRPYIPGDQLRTVNWAVSARRGSLHVTERLTDRAVDVVVLVDMSGQPPGPATAATGRAVEGAVQVVQSALRAGDRAGLIGLGGRQPRWLGPDIGQRQFYRVLDTVLGAGFSDTSTGDHGMGYHSMEGTLAPQPAVPPHAIVIAFSTLLDTAFGLALTDLCKRGHPVVVVDVLQGYPLEDEDEPILRRMWALQRSAMYRDMRVVGVEVVSWPDQVTLDQAMRLLPQATRMIARRRSR